MFGKRIIDGDALIALREQLPSQKESEAWVYLYWRMRRTVPCRRRTLGKGYNWKLKHESQIRRSTPKGRYNRMDGTLNKISPQRTQPIARCTALLESKAILPAPRLCGSVITMHEARASLHLGLSNGEAGRRFDSLFQSSLQLLKVV